MRGGGTSQPLYKGGRAGCPAAGRPVPGTCLQLFFVFFLRKSPYRLATGRPGPGHPAAGRPGPGHPAAGRQGLFRKKTRKIIALAHWTPRCRAAGSPSLIYGLAGPPTPHLHHYNSRNQKEREREGERRSPAGFSSRRLQVTKILLRFTNSMIVCPDMSSNYFC